MRSYIDGFERRDWETGDADGVVRLAVVGLGGFARDFALPALADADYCEPTVAVSGSPDVAAAVAADYDLSATVDYDAFADGAAADDYDAAYVVTPHSLHPEHVAAAAALGKDVLCEKSLAATVEGGERIVEAVAAAGVRFVTAYRLQFEPAIRRARELLADGFVGNPVHVHGHFSVTSLATPDEPADDWRLDPDRSGGGALVDLGLYPLNTTRFLLDADPTSVFGRTRSEHAAFADVDEHVSVVAGFDGHDPSVDAVWTASAQAHRASHLTVIGTDGELTLDPVFYEGERQGLRLDRGGVTSRFTLDPVDQLREQFDYFGHCVLTGEDPRPDARHGLRDLELVEAIYESAERGAAVEV
jgi:xylose dehydrogenase (NAD/NADP)